MCGIVGALSPDSWTLETLLVRSRARGDDGCGLDTINPQSRYRHHLPPAVRQSPQAAVGCARAAPITEDTNQSQPRQSPSGRWVFAHNGLITNAPDDLGLDSDAIGVALDEVGWPLALSELDGTWALVAVDRQQPDRLYWSVRGKPLYLWGRYLVSSAAFCEGLYNPVTDPCPLMLGPHEYGIVAEDLQRQPLPTADHYSSVALCSGGLDAATAAYWWQPSALLYIDYGPRAGVREWQCVQGLASRLSIPAYSIDTNFFWQYAPSTLTQNDLEPSRDGYQATLTADAWTPARNLVLTALAVSWAEARGFTDVVLGLNMDEAGTYVDNDPEFVERYNALLPLATHPDNPVRVRAPLSGMTKRDIVALGGRLGVPWQHTWSCYYGGPEPCGQCGSCYLRGIAFQRAGVRDLAIPG